LVLPTLFSDLGAASWADVAVPGFATEWLQIAGELQSWLLGCFSSLKEKELGVVMMAIYHLWLVRNDAPDEPMF
jgi:hypothetical protein